MCPKITIKTPENVIYVVLVSLLLTWDSFSGVFKVDFEQVNGGWVVSFSGGGFFPA